ncbi:MAG: NAD-dependent deacylase [Candidatus Omnitrophica bacterium]|nr:NAD-dependent protein deacylase Sir2 [bacterium]NUN97642.1 NAD-dependent deacylase [Candidatus Omnitrophota bacterium]
MNLEEGIQRLAERLTGASRVTVLTGAGVSTASGIPTFRDAGGMWKNFRPEEVATPEAFARDPKFVWEWYEVRRQAVLDCRPNRAHEVLAAWSERSPAFRLITQNVDGLHERAGTRNVIRFHGSLFDVGCWEECPQSPHRWRDDTVPFPELPPSCPYCGGILRPGVVWFGEMIDPEVLRRADAALECDLFLSIGTSSQVHPAAALIHTAAALGAFTVEINPEATPASPVPDLSLAGKAEVVLDRVEDVLQRRT